MIGLPSTTVTHYLPTGVLEVLKQSPFIIKSVEIINKISSFVFTYFKVFQGLGMASIGAKSILFEYVRIINSTPSPLSKSVKEFLLKLDQEWAPTGFNVLHGILYLGSGLSYALSAMPKIQNMHLYVNVLNSTGNGLFILANIFSLEYFIKACQESSDILAREHHEIQRQAAERIKTSSILGIFNSAGYLLAPAAILINAPASLAIIFGLIAVSTGCIKIFYDYYYLC